MNDVVARTQGGCAIFHLLVPYGQYVVHLIQLGIAHLFAHRLVGMINVGIGTDAECS